MNAADPLPFGINANAVNLHNFENEKARGPAGPITKLSKNELDVI
jgi:hypothetical protein